MSIPVQTFIDHVNQSIEKALRHESFLHAETLKVGGFATGTFQRLICNLVHLPCENPAYLECGLFKGKSFCAAMNNSRSLTLYGIEDFSQSFDQPDVAKELFENVEKFRADAKSVTIIDRDCFQVDPKEIGHKIQVFYYDGHHDYQFQRDALSHFLDAMDDVFLYLVDDAQWQSVSAGARDGMKLLEGKVKIEREWMLSDGKPDSPIWHNGVLLFLCSKVK